MIHGNDCSEILEKYNNLFKKKLIENMIDTNVRNNIINFLSLGDNVNLFPVDLRKDIISLVADVEFIYGHEWEWRNWVAEEYSQENRELYW